MVEPLFKIVDRDGWKFVVKLERKYPMKPRESIEKVIVEEDELQVVPKSIKGPVLEKPVPENPVLKYLEENGIGYYVVGLKPGYKFDTARICIRNFENFVNPPNAGFLVQRFEGKYTGVKRAHSFQFEVLSHLCNIPYKAVENIRYHSKEQVGLFWSR